MAGGMKEGDWNCAVCGDHQFARNSSCRKCGAPKGSSGPAGGCGAVAGVGLGGCIGGGIAAGGGAGGDMKPGDWICPGCGDMQFARNAMCRRCSTPRPHALGGNGGALTAAAGSHGGGNMKPGDWICASCQDHQYARNESCRRCGAAKPPSAAAAGGALASGAFGGGHGFGAPQPAAAFNVAAMGGKPGDWVCPACGDLQFARNASCRRCGGPKPADAGLGGCAAPAGMLAMAPMGAMGAMPGGMKPGDWSCPQCGDHQFARNETCRRCGGPKPVGAQAGLATAMGAGLAGPGFGRPAQEMKPGDWHCPSCQDLQFARNAACRKCGTPKPADAGADGRPRSRSPRR